MAKSIYEKAKRGSSGAWLERINPISRLSITEARSIYDAARTYGSPRLQKIYDEIELTDPVLMTCVERRQSALAGLGWKVTAQAEADETLAKEQKDAAIRFFNGIDNLTAALEHLDLAFFRGFSHAQPLWDGNSVYHINLLDSWNFLTGENGEWLWNPLCLSDPNGCVPVTSAARLVSLVRRRAIDYPALSIYIRKSLGEADWGRFIERYGIPPVDAIMAPNATNEQKGDYLESAEAARDGLPTVWPNGTITSRAEGSRGQDPFTSFIEHQEKLIVLSATGGTLTSLAQSDTGALAGGAQMDVWEQIVSRDSIVIADAIERGMLRHFLEETFPGQPACVNFTLGTDRKMTPVEVAELAVKIKSAGYVIDQGELEEATGFTLVKDETPAPAGLPFMAREVKPKSKSTVEVEGKVRGDVLSAFAADNAPLARALQDLLKDPSPAAAEKLLADLPTPLPDDPALAAVIAEEMANQFGDGRERTPSAPLANSNDQPRGKTSPGSFAPAAGGGLSDKAKANAEKRQRQSDNKAKGMAGMSTVENGGDCHEFMRSEKLGRIAFYQGNDEEGYLHIKNNPDPNHQVMLKDGNIPNTLAYGKYYKDTYQNLSGWSVVNGDKCVFLGNDGDGVKIISAYASSTKAAVFKGRVALENEEEVLAS